jgi:hypothetical protein
MPHVEDRLKAEIRNPKINTNISILRDINNPYNLITHKHRSAWATLHACDSNLYDPITHKPKSIIGNSNEGSSMHYCTQCVLPSTFPGIIFNDQGICNHCQNYQVSLSMQQKEKYLAKFTTLIGEYRNRRRGSYDILVSYSGGKDSSFTLDLFKNTFGLKVLAFTLDNGFMSKIALENMNKVTEKLSIDYILVKPRFDLLKKIFAAAATNENLYSRKTLERANPICTACISFVKFVGLRMAIEKEIPFLGFGWSPGQAPIQSSVMKVNPDFVKMTQRALLDPLAAIVEEEELRPYFLNDKHFARKEYFPWNIHPLAFMEYNEEKIFHRIEELGWRKPDDTGENSTNCLLNPLAVDSHMKKYHFHPYAWETAGIVRAGGISRSEGLERITLPEPPAIIDYARQRLELA